MIKELTYDAITRRRPAPLKINKWSRQSARIDFTQRSEIAFARGALNGIRTCSRQPLDHLLRCPLRGRTWRQSNVQNFSVEVPDHKKTYSIWNQMV
jgi:hypothetical protein